MNNAKMWLVVKPTVGIPLFLTGVAVGSFAVHVAVLSNTTWVDDFLSGRALGTGMAAATIPGTDDPANAAWSPHPTGSSQENIVPLPDGTTAKAVLQQPVTLAAANGSTPLVVDQ